MHTKLTLGISQVNCEVNFNLCMENLAHTALACCLQLTVCRVVKVLVCVIM